MIGLWQVGRCRPGYIFRIGSAVDLRHVVNYSFLTASQYGGTSYTWLAKSILICVALTLATGDQIIQYVLIMTLASYIWLMRPHFVVVAVGPRLICVTNLSCSASPSWSLEAILILSMLIYECMMRCCITMRWWHIKVLNCWGARIVASRLQSFNLPLLRLSQCITICLTHC